MGSTQGLSFISIRIGLSSVTLPIWPCYCPYLDFNSLFHCKECLHLRNVVKQCTVKLKIHFTIVSIIFLLSLVNHYPLRAKQGSRVATCMWLQDCHYAVCLNVEKEEQEYPTRCTKTNNSRENNPMETTKFYRIELTYTTYSSPDTGPNQFC